MLNLSATFACSGSSSHTSIPGTLVLMGMNCPRYSFGASGFMSYISMCGGPPGSHTNITEVSLPACPLGALFACASSNPASPMPHAAPPISMKDRRETGPGQNEVPSLITVMVRRLMQLVDTKSTAQNQSPDREGFRASYSIPEWARRREASAWDGRQSQETPSCNPPRDAGTPWPTNHWESWRVRRDVHPSY